MKLFGILRELILEQLLPDGGDMFKNVNRDVIVPTLDSIAKFKRITIIDNEGNPVRANSGEELLNAIEMNRITVQEMGKIISSLLKNEAIDNSIVSAAADKFVNSSSFKRQFKDFATMKEGLILMGYSKKAVTAIYKVLNIPEPGEDPGEEIGGTLPEKITSSIKLKRICVLDYDGDEPGGKGRREVEPVALGYSVAGNDVVRAWDFQGASHTAHIGKQPLPGWRLFRLDKILSFVPTEETFDEMRPNYNSTDDKGMSTVLINAKFN